MKAFVIDDWGELSANALTFFCKREGKKLLYELFLPRFEISRAFFRAKQLGERRGNFQNLVEITHKADDFIYTKKREDSFL